jgi:transposase-like protein
VGRGGDDRNTGRRGKESEPAEFQAARELVRQAEEQGLSLTGPDGLLELLTKTVLETALDEELTGHLGHKKGAPAEGGNVRDGTRPRRC